MILKKLKLAFYVSLIFSILLILVVPSIIAEQSEIYLEHCIILFVMCTFNLAVTVLNYKLYANAKQGKQNSTKTLTKTIILNCITLYQIISGIILLTLLLPKTEKKKEIIPVIPPATVFSRGIYRKNNNLINCTDEKYVSLHKVIRDTLNSSIEAINYIK